VDLDRQELDREVPVAALLVASKTVARHERAAFVAALALVEVDFAVVVAVGSVEDVVVGSVEDAAAVDGASYGHRNRLNGGRHDQD
jgi:hypothetical protein